MFASLGAYGHLYPMMPLALACVDAGHDVVIATGEPFLGRLAVPTVPGYPQDLQLGWAIEETKRRHPDLTGNVFAMAMFGHVTAENVAPTMIEQCEQIRPDLVIFEGMDVGSGIAASVPIRSVAYNESSAGVPAWLSGPRTRSRIYLTLGTVSFGAVEVLNRAISETAPLDVDILVAVGPEGEPAALGEVPDNVHVEQFVAQSAVLPLVDLVVHHGGTGTVLGALEVGLPQLLLPQGADQFLNVEILTAAGAIRS
jgi:hypothetical protein